MDARQNHALHASGISLTLQKLDSFLDRRAAFVYLSPALLILAFLFLIPIVVTVFLSFHYWDLSPSTPPQFIGIDNYIEIFETARFWAALRHTLFYVTLALVLQIPLALGIAMMLNREFFGRGLVRTLFLFPMMATPIAVLIGWRMMLDPNAGVIGLLVPFGFPRLALLSDSSLAIPTFVLVDTWRWTPFVTLILLAGLSALPVEPYEAAIMDGASAWQLFLYITLPLLRPVIFVAMLFRVIDALKVFDTIYVLTGVGGSTRADTETLNIYAFSESFEYFHTGYASALLVVFFFIIFAFSLVLIRGRRTDASA